MLADPKSDALVSNFAGQWLQLRNLKTVLPNSDEFPDFDDNLRQAFQRETELFFESIMREDRSVLDLLTADYTFVNERLARHYGIPEHLRQPVPPRPDHGRGAEGAARTGEHPGGDLACRPHVAGGARQVDPGEYSGHAAPAASPERPGAEGKRAGANAETVRERMAEHRANPVCASCHKVMDPLGFALENFDAVGAWRTREAGGPIDASGQLADGTRVDGVVSLRQALLRHPDVFVRTMTEKMLTYALGRGLDYHDMPAVRSIVRRRPGNDYRFSSLVLGIVNSVPFQMRMAQGAKVEARG